MERLQPEVSFDRRVLIADLLVERGVESEYEYRVAAYEYEGKIELRDAPLHLRGCKAQRDP